jgi:hypothetical protein
MKKTERLNSLLQLQPTKLLLWDFGLFFKRKRERERGKENRNENMKK